MQRFNKQPIILFDGMCNLCSGGVDFVINRDPHGVFRFCPVQSETAEKLLTQHGLSDIGNDTFILIQDNRCYFRSDAALQVFQRLNGLWPLLRFLRFIPRSIRDVFYNLIAQNRYRLFGQRHSCKRPKKEWENRFLI